MPKLRDWFLDLLFPTRCVLCRRLLPPGQPRICPSCQEDLPLLDDPRTRVRNLYICVSAVYYENEVREAIHRFKFGGQSSYADAFGELVAEKIYEELAGEWDVLSWVPVSPDRKRRRGYDQAYLLAKAAAKKLCVKPIPTLRKKRGVRKQSRVRNREERQANILGSFSAPDPSVIEGKRVLLIDDILTTGATLSEAAKTLLFAGAEQVVAATLAKTR